MRRFVPLLISIALHGCGYLANLPRTYSPASLPARRFDFRDGGHAVFFSLEKREGAARGPLTFMFVAAGADCTSMKYFLPDYFRGLEGEAGPVRIYLLQKRHIEARTWGREFGCGGDFTETDHPSRWLADQEEFIAAQLEAAAKRGERPGRLVIAGISEGAYLVPELARRFPATHAVVVANGGLNPFDTYRLQAQRFPALRPVYEEVERAVAGGRPDAEVVAGRSLKYWREMAASTYAASLRGMEAPVFIAMGERDELVPVEAACAVEGMGGKISVTVYPGADHGLRAGRKDFLPDMWHQIEMWWGGY